MINFFKVAFIRKIFGDKTKALLFIILFSFSILNLYIVFKNHYSFNSFAYDYGVYNFAFFDFANFRVSPCPIYLFSYPITFLQDHFSFALIVLSPLYWLLSPIFGTYTLLFIQTCIIAFGGWATYKLIFFKSNNYKIATLALIFYFILLGRFTAASADCNLAIIGSSIIPVFLYYFERKKILATILCFLFLLITREDYALWLFFICSFLMIIHRKEKFKLTFSAALFTLSIIFFFIVFKFIIPALEDENKKYNLFAFTALGKTPLEAIRYLFHDPLRCIELLFINHSNTTYFNGVKADFYIIYLFSGGFLLFIRPVYLLPFLPIIAKKMYADDPVRWSSESYYSIEFVSILPVMVFLLIAGLKKDDLKLPIALLICCWTIIMTSKEIYRAPEKHRARLGSPAKYDLFNKDYYLITDNIKEIYTALKRIPDNASVSASSKLLPHLAYREKIYYYPKVEDAEYICLFKNDTWPASQEESDKKLDQLVSEGGWKILVDKNNFLLLSNK